MLGKGVGELPKGLLAQDRYLLSKRLVRSIATSRMIPVKTKDCLRQTNLYRSQQYEDWPSSIPANNCLTGELMEIIRKSI